MVSSDSATSLLASSRKPNGSEVKQPAAPQVPDSINILEKLLAADSEIVGKAQGKASLITEEDLGLDVDFGGQSLKELAAGSFDSDATSFRRPQNAIECALQFRRAAPDDYISLPHANVSFTVENDKARFDALHRSIVACDDILNSVEINLADFRNDLSTVSADIETLQTRSSILSRRLENRKRIEKALGPLVEELSVSPETIYRITTSHIDEAWAKTLNELDKRASAVQKLSGTQQGKASEELVPILEKLILKVTVQ